MTRQKGVWSSSGNLLRAGVLFLALGAGPVAANDPATQKPFAWPGGAKAAVSLTYDDAVPVHYQKVGPLLSKHGLGATFYLTVQYLESPREWRKLSKRGHELGNHTLFHACRQDPDVVAVFWQLVRASSAFKAACVISSTSSVCSVKSVSMIS